MTQLRDVWVSAAQRHIPAHRIPVPLPPSDPGTSGTFPVACPPGVAYGGRAITRAQARELAVFPCVHCFALPAPEVPEPGPAVAPDDLLDGVPRDPTPPVQSQ